MQESEIPLALCVIVLCCYSHNESTGMMSSFSASYKILPRANDRRGLFNVLHCTVVMRIDSK